MGNGVFAQWYLDLSIAGQRINATPRSLTNFEIVQNIHQHLPSIYLTVKDPAGRTNSDMFNVKDGDPIKVSVGVPGIKIYEGLEFAVIGAARGNPGRDGVTIIGILNNMQWLRKIVDFGTEGNASDVFSKMASKAGLKPVVDASADSMYWLPNRTSFAEYGKFLADRAYASKSSAFIAAVTDTGKALFKNIDTVVQGGATKIFSQFFEQGSIPVLEYEVASKTHIANNSRGYGATGISQETDGTVKELNKVDVRALSSALPFGAGFVSAIGDLGNRIMQFSNQSGNTHDKWLEAQHQNMRVKSSYGFDIHVLTDSPADVQLMDKVQFKPMDRFTGNVMKSLAGDYIVTAITKTVTNPERYLEKITLTSQGPN